MNDNNKTEKSETLAQIDALKEIAASMEIIIEEMSHKIVHGRIKDYKKEEIKLKQIRTYTYLCKTCAEIENMRIQADLPEKMEKLRELFTECQNKKR